MWEIQLVSYEGMKDKRMIESTRVEDVLSEIKMLIEKFRVIKIIDLDRIKYTSSVIEIDGGLPR